MNRRDFFRRAGGQAVNAAVVVAAPLTLLAKEPETPPLLLGCTVNGTVHMNGDGLRVEGCIINSQGKEASIQISRGKP